MNKLVFYVQGSAKEPYKVTFWKDENNKIRSGCNCTASKNGFHCKHKIQLIAGELTNVVSKEDSSSFLDLENLLQGTDIQSLCENFKNACTGEQISKFSNSYQRINKLFEKAELLTPISMEEIPTDIFENNFVYKSGKTNIIYQLNEEPIFVFIADKRKLAKLELTQIRPSIFTKSNYYIECYNIFCNTNMSVLREKMTKALVLK